MVKLTEEIASAEKAKDKAKVEALTAKKTQARKNELAAIDWKMLWGIPAAFAGVILLIFCVTFHDRSDTDPSQGTGEAIAESDEMAPADGFPSPPNDVDDG